ncbi:MAG: CueP family metal-binding protein [Deltaproteobacteria bacterium]
MTQLSFRNFIAAIVVLPVILYSGMVFAQHGHNHVGVPDAVVSKDQKLRDELKGIDAKQAMAIAYKWRQENIDVKTFVTPDAVNFQFKDGKTVAVPLPDDQMIVSIAPYVNKTHPCATHTMSSCKGELKDTPIEVKAVTASGKILIDESIVSPFTGFIDLWLPRDQEITLYVSALGKKTKGVIATFRSSKTCDSTLKLE